MEEKVAECQQPSGVDETRITPLVPSYNLERASLSAALRRDVCMWLTGQPRSDFSGVHLAVLQARGLINY